MDKTIKKIIELNKKFYLDKKFNNDIYVQELISIIQSHTLDYNLYLQTQNMSFLSQFIKINSNNYSFSESELQQSSFKSGITKPTLSEISTVDAEDAEDAEDDIDAIDAIDAIDSEDVKSNETFVMDTVNDNTTSTNTVTAKDKYEKYNTIDYIDQCCARVNNKIYNLDDYEPEFIDNYPSGVYINNSGHIIGSPCCNTVTEFDEFNNIFCNKHKNGFEDIREPPFVA